MTKDQNHQLFAEKLVQEGGAIALRDFNQQKFSTEWKSDHSYVTQSDTEIETRFRSLIATEYPDHSIYGEEYGGSLDPSRPTWILDPLDGTTNFSHHIPLFCSMAALQIDGKIVAAAVSSPIQDLIFSASLGAGATVNNKPFPKPSQETELDSITLLLDSGKSPDARADSFHFLATCGHQFRSFRKFGCMVAPLLYAIHSKLEAAIIFGVDLYDIAGLSLIMSEAGYTTLGKTGDEWRLTENSDFIVTTSALKSKIEVLV